jgi:hypothetical protein
MSKGKGLISESHTSKFRTPSSHPSKLGAEHNPSKTRAIPSQTTDVSPGPIIGSAPFGSGAVGLARDLEVSARLRIRSRWSRGRRRLACMMVRKIGDGWVLIAAISCRRKVNNENCNGKGESN